jgi:hypothetical protein
LLVLKTDASLSLLFCTSGLLFFLENPTFVLKTDLDFGSKFLRGRTVRGVGIAQVFLLLFLLCTWYKLKTTKRETFTKKLFRQNFAKKNNVTVNSSKVFHFVFFLSK